MTRSIRSREGVDEVRAYVAGPMSGYPRHNFDAFESTCDRLRADGYFVTSPHELDLAEGLDPAAPGAGRDVRSAISSKVEAVRAADLVVLLPGWEQSPSARMEVLLAGAHNVPCIPVADVISARIA